MTLVNCPKLKVPAAMLSVRIPFKYASDPTVQRKVRRLRDSMLAKLKTTPPTVLAASFSPCSDVSSITASESSAKAVFPPPKGKQVRKTPIGTQQVRASVKAACNHNKRAHKHATSHYAAEKKKKKGEDGKLSATAVTKNANKCKQNLWNPFDGSQWLCWTSFVCSSERGYGKPLNKLEWEKIVAAGTTPPTFDEWTEENEAELESLKDVATISMTDTSYGRLVAGKKKELLAAAGKMNENERAEMMSAWAKEDVLHDKGSDEEAQAELIGGEAAM